MSFIEEDSLMLKFRIKVIKEKIIPCMSDDIDNIVINRKVWEKIQVTYEYLRDILLVGSLISCFFNSRLATGILVSITGTLIKLVSHAQGKQIELTERLNIYLKQIGINNLIPEIEDKDSLPEIPNLNISQLTTTV